MNTEIIISLILVAVVSGMAGMFIGFHWGIGTKEVMVERDIIKGLIRHGAIKEEFLKDK